MADDDLEEQLEGMAAELVEVVRRLATINEELLNRVARGAALTAAERERARQALEAARVHGARVEATMARLRLSRPT